MEKTFVSLTVLWLLAKLFSAKFGGMVSFDTAQVRNLRKFSLQKNLMVFFTNSWKFSPLKVFHYMVCYNYMVCINWGSSYYSRNRLKNADSTIFAKVFSIKFGGMVSFGMTWVSNSWKLYFSPIRKSFLPWKFPTIRMVCYTWCASIGAILNLANIKCAQYMVNMISHCRFSEGGGGPGVVEVNSGRAVSRGMGGWGACLRASTDGEGWPLCVRSNTTRGKKNGSQWKDWNHVLSACPSRRVWQSQ